MRLNPRYDVVVLVITCFFVLSAEPLCAQEAEADATEATASETVADEPTEVAPTVADLTPEQIQLRDKLKDCLDFYYYEYPLNSQAHTSWEIMHMVIGFGIDAMHERADAGNEMVNSIAWLCYNNTCRHQRMLYLHQGRPRGRIARGLEGHHGQFLAVLAQAGVKADYPMRVSGKKMTVADLIEQEKLTCRPRSELSFKLIGLVHYLGSDENWQSEQGETWNIARILKEEIAQPISGSSCGGTHRMMGLSYAVHKRRQREEPFTGQWGRAKKYVEDYHDYTFKLQNPDGSMSTSFFRRRNDQGGVVDRVRTTGHVLEWLVFSLPDENLGDERVTKAVHYLTDALNSDRRRKWHFGTLGHAVHALVLYEQRVFGAKPGQRRREWEEKADVREASLGESSNEQGQAS